MSSYFQQHSSDPVLTPVETSVSEWPLSLASLSPKIVRVHGSRNKFSKNCFADGIILLLKIFSVSLLLLSLMY